MSITFDEAWITGPNGRSRVRHVHRNQEAIGRGRQWQEDDCGLAREWFTADRKEGAFYEPIVGEHANFGFDGDNAGWRGQGMMHCRAAFNEAKPDPL